MLEVRDALGNRIPKQFNALVWIFALCFGVPYFLFGISGVAVFILAIFIIGCAISVFSQLNEAVVHLAYFSFLLIYPAFVMSAMFFINKSMDSSGNLLDIHTVGLALVFLVASCTDMFAYFFGSLFGRHKLVPSISPKKTWEGAAGGLFGGLVGAGIVYLLFETPFEPSQVEAGHAAFAREQLHFGVQRFEQGAFPAPDAAEQINEFARRDAQIHIGEYHLAPLEQFGFGRAAERVVRMINSRVFQSYNVFFTHRAALWNYFPKIVKIFVPESSRSEKNTL